MLLFEVAYLLNFIKRVDMSFSTLDRRACGRESYSLI